MQKQIITWKSTGFVYIKIQNHPERKKIIWFQQPICSHCTEADVRFSRCCETVEFSGKWLQNAAEILFFYKKKKKE